MKKVFGVILVLLLAVSFLAACGGAAAEPANFTLSSVTVSPSAPVVNGTVTIGTTVTNAGGQSGSCDVSLTIDGYTNSTSVSSLAVGASTPVSFSYPATTKGNYTATVSTPNATKSRSFTVSEEGVTPPLEGAVPVWAAGDKWVYTSSYVDAKGKSYADVNLTVTFVAEEAAGVEEGVAAASYKLSAVYVPKATFIASDMPLQLNVATADVWNSKDYMEYLKLKSSIDQLPGVPSSVTWTYTGDYGWPYDVEKTWSAALRTVAGTIIDKTVQREYKVLGVETITVPAGTFSCYHIVEYDPKSPGTYVGEHWFNATVVKSNVKEIDRETWSGAETRVLTSYSVS